jgi:hypothetical protein
VIKDAGAQDEWLHFDEGLGPPPPSRYFDSKILLGNGLDSNQDTGGIRIRFGLGRMRRGGGGLDALQQEAGALGVERVVGDAHGDLGDGDADGLGTEERREDEGSGASGSALVVGGWALGMVVKAERLAAEGEGAAAVAGGVGVGAA